MTAAYTTERQAVRPARRQLPGRPHPRCRRLHPRRGGSAHRLGGRLAALGPAATPTEAVAVAKYWAAEGGQFVAYACQHLHGGIGIDVDYPLHRYFIWSIQNEHSFGGAHRAAGGAGRPDRSGLKRGMAAGRGPPPSSRPLARGYFRAV